MLFNSPTFAVFLLVVFVTYWFVLRRSTALQNLFLLGASYLFYAWWDWRYLSLIVLSSFIDYSVGMGLGRTDRPGARRALLWVSIGVNLGLLGAFKYFNFFADSLQSALGGVGLHVSPITLDVVLPVGISFYTFQTLSYTIDVYRRSIEPTRDAVAFFAFVSFFPQLVAGPIERASRLLPQFTAPREFSAEDAEDGLRQILAGMFKKVVLADTCGTIADQVFGNYAAYSSPSLILGVVCFAFQIYGDFSGYSDIAIGSAKLFGFRLMRNFYYPYFSRDIAEFWRRWHVSLSTWFRDYVYIPLGGSRGTRGRIVANVMIVFLVSGLWHGANWTFVVWGGLNGIYFLPLLLLHRNRRYTGSVAEGRLLPAAGELGQILLTFLLTLLAWVFFRAPTVGDALAYLQCLFTNGGGETATGGALAVGLIVLVVVVEWIQREHDHALHLVSVPVPVRHFVYLVLMSAIVYAYRPASEFIYFQF